MAGFNFFFHFTDTFLLFSEESFALGALPCFAHKRIQHKYLYKMDYKKEGPKYDGPQVPVMGFPVFEHLVDHNQEDTSDEENHKMPEEPSFLPDPSLGMLQEFML